MLAASRSETLSALPFGHAKIAIATPASATAGTIWRIRLLFGGGGATEAGVAPATDSIGTTGIDGLEMYVET
jgi:hypothetical protein